MRPPAPGTDSSPAVPALAAALPELEHLLAQQDPLEAKYSEAMDPVDALIRAWDFAAAEAALERLRFDESELAERLLRRREEVARFAALKERMVQRINAAQPPLTKRDLALRGLGGNVAGADASAVSMRLATGKQETLAWDGLGQGATEKLLALVVDDEITLPVQINGKKRGDLTISRDADQSAVEQAALALEAVQAALDGKSPRKVIVVPQRIVNVVA